MYDVSMNTPMNVRLGVDKGEGEVKFPGTIILPKFLKAVWFQAPAGMARRAAAAGNAG
jgi:hypothetical protein